LYYYLPARVITITKELKFYSKEKQETISSCVTLAARCRMTIQGIKVICFGVNEEPLSEILAVFDNP